MLNKESIHQFISSPMQVHYPPKSFCNNLAAQTGTSFHRFLYFSPLFSNLISSFTLSSLSLLLLYSFFCLFLCSFSILPTLSVHQWSLLSTMFCHQRSLNLSILLCPLMKPYCFILCSPLKASNILFILTIKRGPSILLIKTMTSTVLGSSSSQ